MNQLPPAVDTAIRQIAELTSTTSIELCSTGCHVRIQYALENNDGITLTMPTNDVERLNKARRFLHRMTLEKLH